MGAFAEGMQLLHKQKNNFNLDIKEVSKVYAHGSIIESRLASWLYEIIKADPEIRKVAGTVPKGETEKEMEQLEKMSDMPVLHAARLMRVKTRKKPSFAGKVVAALRNAFGGHKVFKK